MIRLLLLLFLLVASPSAAQDFLVGDTSADSSGNFNNSWKCVQYAGLGNGTPNECRVQFYEVTAGYNSINVGCAVYIDNGSNRPGDLIASGCLTAFDFTTLTRGDWFSIPLSASTEIMCGPLYWTCFIDDSSSNLWVYRANDPPSSTFRKLIKAPSLIAPCSAPDGSFFSTAGTVTGSYNFAVYGMYATSSTTTTVSEPCYGDFDCDGDVDGLDIWRIKQHFGRSQYRNPCPTDSSQPYCD